jgi:phage shock protein A
LKESSMSVIRKMVTLLRGSARELGESLVDAHAMTIYEQEIADARASIGLARGELAGVMAKQMKAGREVERLRAEAARYEALAVQALDKAQDALAEEVAAQVLVLEAELAEQQRAEATFFAQVQRLKELLQSAEARLRDHEREAEIAKTTESVYRATQSISDNMANGGGRLVSARESLERIKRRHEDLADRLQAGERIEDELGGAALDRKLAEAGIGPEAERRRAVMERIRARRAQADAGAGADADVAGGASGGVKPADAS